MFNMSNMMLSKLFYKIPQSFLFYPKAPFFSLSLSHPVQHTWAKRLLRQQEVSGADPETFRLPFLILSAEPLSLGNPPPLQVHAELLF